MPIRKFFFRPSNAARSAAVVVWILGSSPLLAGAPAPALGAPAPAPALGAPAPALGAPALPLVPGLPGLPLLPLDPPAPMALESEELQPATSPNVATANP